ncbi:MAG: primosomal protein N' [Parachlamydiales bacterium]|jgi:primosomal protein N' (replication factor Y)
MSIASVILDNALDKRLDYSIPENLQGKITPGMRIEVSVRGRTCYGTVSELKNESSFGHLKPILSIVGEGDSLPPDLFELAQWMSNYYAAPLRNVIRSLLPASVRKDAGHQEQLFVMRVKTREEIIEAIPAIRTKAPSQAKILETILPAVKGMFLSVLLEKAESTRSAVDALVKKGFLEMQMVRIDRSPLEDEEYFLTPPRKLTPEQTVALQNITSSIDKQSFQTHLLYGVTGSGKTEVYLQAIEHTLAVGKSAIMMVPEIALTIQTIERFRCRFNEKMAILHYRLSDGERYDAWQDIHKGKISIVIGARSVVFSPLPNLGLIIVDEEHEQSYKQTDQMPCYNARDIAVMRGKLSNATVVLGSATPSLETYQNAIKGKYGLSKLTMRPDNAKLPSVTIVDMKREYEKAQGPTTFSEKLLDGISQRMKKGEQTILFLNRRGYHTMQMCKACGGTIKCNDCDTSLTFHRGDNCLSCHLCGFTLSPPPRQCPACKSEDTLKFRGVGTELVERSLQAIFPEVRTLRIDADTTKHKGSHQKLLRDFGTGKADVLVGTQMIAKGLHFPEVTLVGVLNCDSSLNIPDFRSSEHTFQLLSQVAGRAGRGVALGEVIIQTCVPENSVIQHAARQDFESFFAEELSTREIFGYPPFTQLAKIAFSGKDAQAVSHIAEVFRAGVERKLPQTYLVMALLPAGHSKVKGNFKYQFLIRGPAVYPMVQAYLSEEQRHKSKNVKISIDVNPYSTFF